MTGMKPKEQAMVTPKGDVVHELRRNRGLTLAALEALIIRRDGQASQRKIQQVERSEPTRRYIVESIARALDVPVEALLFDIVDATKTLIEELYVKQSPGSLERLKKHFDDSVEFWISGNPAVIPFAGKYIGHSGVRQFFEALFGVIAPRCNDPPPLVSSIVADHPKGSVVVDLENDLVRHRLNPQRTLTCKVKCTFRFREGKLVHFEDLFDTAAWELFLSDTKTGHFCGPNPGALS